MLVEYATEQHAPNSTSPVRLFAAAIAAPVGDAMRHSGSTSTPWTHLPAPEAAESHSGGRGVRKVRTDGWGAAGSEAPGGVGLS